MKHCQFINLSAPKDTHWGLTGAVTFYQAPFKMDGCMFSGNYSEDALNTVRSRFSLRGIQFDDISSDALDIDFSDGTISDSVLRVIGNDAIDISGSTVTILNIFITATGDKGISVGENSRVQADRIKISDAAIGACSKDMSTLTLNNSTLQDCRIGLAVYKKKPEFGPATLVAEQLEVVRIDSPWLVEQGSSLTVNKRSISPSKKKISTLLYGKSILED